MASSMAWRPHHLAAALALNEGWPRQRRVPGDCRSLAEPAEALDRWLPFLPELAVELFHQRFSSSIADIPKRRDYISATGEMKGTHETLHTLAAGGSTSARLAGAQDAQSHAAQVELRDCLARQYALGKGGIRPGAARVKPVYASAY